MYRILVGIAALSCLIISCASENCISDNFSADDLQVTVLEYEFLDEETSTQTLQATLSGAPNEELTFEWEVGGQSYEGRTIELQGMNNQDVKLTVSDELCSISNEFQHSFAKAVIGDQIWRAVNEEELCEGGAEIIENIELNLFSAADFSLVANTNTDAFGRFLFQSLDPGSYIIQVAKPDVLAFVTRFQCENSSVDEDGFTEVITLGFGEVNLNVSAGIIY